MVHQASGQLDFADALMGCSQKLNQCLDKLNGSVDWKPFEAKLSRIYSSTTGRPSYPLLLLLKSFLLQAWYNLSDYELEAALDDRFSFRRFVGLSAAGQAPDHSTFSRFREQLVRHGMQDQLFKELDRQLETKGLMVKKGTLIDATVIEAAPKRPNQNPMEQQGNRRSILKRTGRRKVADFTLAIRRMWESTKRVNSSAA